MYAWHRKKVGGGYRKKEWDEGTLRMHDTGRKCEAATGEKNGMRAPYVCMAQEENERRLQEKKNGMRAPYVCMAQEENARRLQEKKNGMRAPYVCMAQEENARRLQKKRGTESDTDVVKI